MTVLTDSAAQAGRGHALTIDSSWSEVADTAPTFTSASPKDRKEARMLTEERLIAREGARYWWLFLVSGILWLLIAWMVLRLNATSITTVGVLLGVVFLIAGITLALSVNAAVPSSAATSSSETVHGIISTATKQRRSS